MKPIYFETPAEFRRWLEKNHAKATELLVGFHKRGTGKPSMTWPESVDEALCFGWIDGIRKSVDSERYTIRFTPRRARSIWSLVNVRRVKALTQTGRLRPAGLAAFKARHAARSGVYSFEQRPQRLEPAFEKQFRANRIAWVYFQSQAPWYRRTSIYWVMSAKKEETRRRRLEALIRDSAAGRSIKPLTRTPAKRA
jgi:uncharacterized protein YdeI (YjbR/CyaY-like superfamily)